MSRRAWMLVAVLVPLVLVFVWVAFRSGPLAPVRVTVVTVEERAIAPALFGIGTSTSPWVGAIPALCYLGLHAIESNVVTPSILGKRFTTNPVLILLALSYFTWIWGVTGALLSVPILLTLTALVEHLGKPNLIGFIFGEPLFATNPLAADEETAAEASSSLTA